MKEWAHTTGGMFPTADGGGYVRWEARGSAERRTIHWGRLKTEERAIEKAIRCSPTLLSAHLTAEAPADVPVILRYD